MGNVIENQTNIQDVCSKNAFNKSTARGYAFYRPPCGKPKERRNNGRDCFGYVVGYGIGSDIQ